MLTRLDPTDERRIAELLDAGWGNRDIAQEVCVCPDTVRARRFRRYGFRTVVTSLPHGPYDDSSAKSDKSP